MTPERWCRVGELFHESFDIAPAERTVWINSVLAADPAVGQELVSLLESDRAAGQGLVQGRLKSAVVSFYEETTAAEPLERVGPYRLVRELGRGGMGTVYLAERDDEQYETKVAIKLVRPGMDTDFVLQRFRRERQTLAHLQHPNIARLLDGGATEGGLPYIVMEYVEGSWITEYCQRHALNIDKRLTLFLDVCSAVEYAHRQFVVHRDIKPGNILVDQSGSAKLLDFGICKLLHTDPMAPADTMDSGARMLTPDYASPEQILGDPITVASDVYSLAAVLYELLTGTKPHRIEKCTPQAIERVICEQDVVRPSLAAGGAVARRLRGDLDNILLRALQKDPQRRYPSVEQFSEDLRRHLSHQPVMARPDTLTYRLRKFTRRRRGAVAAGAAIILSLTGGIVVALREARTANQNLLQVRRLANTFVFDVHDAVRDLPGSIRARKLIVETGLQYLDRLAKNSRGDTELRNELAAAYQRIGDVQGDVLNSNLGNTAAALDSYRKALSLLDSTVGRDGASRDVQVRRVTLHQRIGGIDRFTRNPKQALASYREAERLGEALRTRYPGDDAIQRQLAQIYTELGDMLRVLSEPAAALDETSKGVALLLASSAAHPDDRSVQYSLAGAYSNIGMNEVRLGRLKDGLGHYQQAAAQMERLAALEPANASYQRELMYAYAHVGDALGSPYMPSLGDTAGAIAAYRRLVDMARRLYEADPTDQRVASDYGGALSRLGAALPEGQLAGQIALPRESVKVLEEVARVNPGNLPNRADLAYSYVLLGDALAASGDRAGAVRYYREAQALLETLVNYGQRAPVITLIDACRKLAEEAARQGDRAASLAYARRALEVSDPAAASAKERPAGMQLFLTPRGYAAMGLTYAWLARAANTTSEQAREDREQAGVWLEKSLTAWRNAQADPAFAPPHRREMQRAEATLSAVRKRKSKGIQ